MSNPTFRRNFSTYQADKPTLSRRTTFSHSLGRDLTYQPGGPHGPRRTTDMGSVVRAGIESHPPRFVLTVTRVCRDCHHYDTRGRGSPGFRGPHTAQKALIYNGLMRVFIPPPRARMAQQWQNPGSNSRSRARVTVQATLGRCRRTWISYPSDRKSFGSGAPSARRREASRSLASFPDRATSCLSTVTAIRTARRATAA